MNVISLIAAVILIFLHFTINTTLHTGGEVGRDITTKPWLWTSISVIKGLSIICATCLSWSHLIRLARSHDCRRDLFQAYGWLSGCTGQVAHGHNVVSGRDSLRMGTLRSPSNPHPSQTLISRRPPLLSICVCDSETACNQLLGGVYVCLCVHVCVCMWHVVFSSKLW